MIDRPDDHLRHAIVEAQTRAMNAYPDSRVSLRLERTRELLREAASRYRPGCDMGRLLELVLDLHEPFTDDAERRGYKIALGIEFNRRKCAGIDAIRELERTRPFSPREHA